MLKYSQPPTFLNLRGHPSSNLSVEILTQLPFHTCGILCSLDTTQHVPMLPAGRVSMVTRILLGYYTYTVVYSHITSVYVFMIGDGVLTVSIQMSGWFLCVQAKLVASACVKLPIWSGGGYQGCGLSSTAQLVNTCQVKTDRTTGDYRYIFFYSTCELCLFDDPYQSIAFI